MYSNALPDSPQAQPLYPPLESSTLTTGQFLRLYFSQCQTGFVEITYLCPPELKVYPRTVTAWRPLPIDSAPDSPEQIMAKNQRGYGCYFGTTVSGRRYDPEERISEKTGRPYLQYFRRHEKDVTLAPAIWVDIDDVSAAETRLALLNLPVMPNIIVKSGGGVHGYWLLDEPVEITGENKTEFKRVLHGVANLCGGDTKARDLARIMRLPGTVNTKPTREGARCEVIDWMPGFYRYDQLRELFLQTAPREIIEPTRVISTEASDHDLPAVTRKFLNEPPASYRNTTLYAAARGCNDAGLSRADAEALLTATALATGLERHEVERTIRSAYDAAPAPLLPPHMRLRMAMGDRLKGGAE